MHVYFIQAGEYVKIGITENLTRRLASLQHANPLPLVLIRAVEGDTDREQAIHRRFAHLRVRGEWFHCTNDLLEYALTISHEWVPKDKAGYLVPHWLSCLLDMHNLGLEQVRIASSIYPVTLCDWARSRRTSPSVSGKVAKALGMTSRDLVAMRNAALDANGLRPSTPTPADAGVGEGG